MMQYWEYCTASLEAVPISLTKCRGWRLKEIDEQEQPDWKKSQVYPSLAAFCNQMSQQGWELLSVAYPERYATHVILYLKRLMS